MYVYVHIVKWKLLSRVQLFVIPCTIRSMEFSRPEYWSGYFPSSRGSSQPRDQSQVSRIAGRFFTSWATRKTHVYIWLELLVIHLHAHYHAAPQCLLAPHHGFPEHRGVLQLRRWGVCSSSGQLRNGPPQQIHPAKAKAQQGGQQRGQGPFPLMAELACPDDCWGCLQRIVNGLQGLWARSPEKGSKPSLLCPQGWDWTKAKGWPCHLSMCEGLELP